MPRDRQVQVNVNGRTWNGVQGQLKDAIRALPPQFDLVKDFLNGFVKAPTQEPETVSTALVHSITQNFINHDLRCHIF